MELSPELLPIETFAKAVGVTRKAAARGINTSTGSLVQIGHSRFVHVAAREWLMSKLKQPTGVTEPNRHHTPEARAKISAAMKRRRDASVQLRRPRWRRD